MLASKAFSMPTTTQGSPQDTAKPPSPRPNVPSQLAPSPCSRAAATKTLVKHYRTWRSLQNGRFAAGTYRIVPGSIVKSDQHKPKETDQSHDGVNGGLPLNHLSLLSQRSAPSHTSLAFFAAVSAAQYSPTSRASARLRAAPSSPFESDRAKCDCEQKLQALEMCGRATHVQTMRIDYMQEQSIEKLGSQPVHGGCVTASGNSQCSSSASRHRILQGHNRFFAVP